MFCEKSKSKRKIRWTYTHYIYLAKPRQRFQLKNFSKWSKLNSEKAWFVKNLKAKEEFDKLILTRYI